MENIASLFNRKIRLYDDFNVQVKTMKEGIGFEEKHYSQRIAYDSCTRPYRERKESAVCRCGSFVCPDCKMAFDAWTIDHLEKIFARDLRNLCTIRFRIPVFDKEVPTVKGAREEAISYLHSLHCDKKKSVGIVDIIKDDHSKRFDRQVCSLYCVLFTTSLTGQEMRDIRYRAEDDGPYYRLEVTTSLHVDPDLDHYTDGESVMNYEYAAWCWDMQQLSNPRNSIDSSGVQSFVPKGLQTDRIFFFRVRNLERMVTFTRLNA